MLKMFFPQVSMPKRSDVEDQIGRVYPGARNYYHLQFRTMNQGNQFFKLKKQHGQEKQERIKKEVLNEKGRRSYERENPGSDLKAPSKKVGNPRRKSFCARMKGMKKKLTSSKTANDPDSRINKSLRKWNC